MKTTGTNASANQSRRSIQEAVKRVTESQESARKFLQSAGIMTSKGNLSPKYK